MPTSRAMRDACERARKTRKADLAQATQSLRASHSKTREGTRCEETREVHYFDNGQVKSKIDRVVTDHYRESDKTHVRSNSQLQFSKDKAPALPSSGRPKNNGKAPAPPSSGRPKTASDTPPSSGRRGKAPAPPSSGRRGKAPAPPSSGRRREASAPPSSGRRGKAPAPPSSGRRREAPAKSEWETFICPVTNREYEHNEITNETRWKTPPPPPSTEHHQYDDPDATYAHLPDLPDADYLDILPLKGRKKLDKQG